MLFFPSILSFMQISHPMHCFTFAAAVHFMVYTHSLSSSWRDVVSVLCLPRLLHSTLPCNTLSVFSSSHSELLCTTLFLSFHPPTVAFFSADHFPVLRFLSFHPPTLCLFFFLRSSFLCHSSSHCLISFYHSAIPCSTLSLSLFILPLSTFRRTQPPSSPSSSP